MSFSTRHITHNLGSECKRLFSPLDSRPLRLYFLRNRLCSCIMQTLNVGAGRTDEEYKATEEQRRADLRSDCRDDANYFFWAAGLSALGTGLLPVRLNLLVSIGTVDLLTLYGRPLGPFYPLAVFSLAAMWLLVMLGLGFAGRSGHRWAFGRDRYLCRRHDRSHSHI